ncbi:hypothetical protein [Anaeropeptidivorans aminofermentans]|jgi:predicted nucleic acid-binding Zn ribbon protein|uniref:hypothetical protein n=1 Tax=Anaeropeptidivorans aminofermentans TaxID=2934315 RepID=UPI002023C578|nr:hypothetical protein [Anaeropeptidivorans aminofermentans]
MNKKISKKAINKILFLIILSIVLIFVVGPMADYFWGPVSKYIYILSLAILIWAAVLAQRKARCPYCGGPVKLDDIFQSKKKARYCQNCGKPIEIDEKN